LVNSLIGQLVNARRARAGRRGNYPFTNVPSYQSRIADAGFTIIELLVVVSLIVILATMGMSQYRSSVIHAREATLKEDLFRLRDAIDQYYADKGKYPSSLDALVSDGYMRKVPDDPFTNSNSTWQTIPAEPDPNNPAAEAGVFDVKSGSDGTALDGSKYAEW
jgi:general secretion pathway protein G